MSEGDLYQEVCELLDLDRSYFSLLASVRFECLLTSSIRRFVDSAHDFVDLFDSSILPNVFRGLFLPVSPATSNEWIALRGRRFAPSLDSPLGGIVSHLTSTCGGNAHDLGGIDVSATGVHRSYFAKHALDLRNHNSFFQSKNEADSSIRCDFENTRIVPTHYAVLSRYDSP